MNKMTGDPNQDNRPSVFTYERYPSHNLPIDWNVVSISPTIAPTASHSNFHPELTYQQSHLGPGKVSFCSTPTPYPAQFPFPTAESDVFTHSPAPPLRCKRKTEEPFGTLQSKKHISEEKIAEHMARLHISSETASSSKESEGERTQRLYMCEEMRKLQSDSILPQYLLSKIQRPCTALVLWTPPRRFVAAEHSDPENGNNNEENAPDHNRILFRSLANNDANNMDLDHL